MVVCKFFLQGTCRFGEMCKFQHQIDNRPSTSILRQQNVGGTGIDINTILRTISNDMVAAEKGGQWLLSCYAPFREKPCFPGFEDQSFEELRWGFYQAQSNGSLEQYKLYLQQTLQETIVKVRALQNSPADVINIVKRLYGSSSSYMPSTNVFRTQNPPSYPQTQGGSIFAQNNQQTGNSMFSQSQQPGGNIFTQNNQQTGGNVFTQNNQQIGGSIFAQNNQQTGSTGFAQANQQGSFNQPQPSSTGSIFASANQQLFGNNQSTFQQQGSIFQQAGNNSAFSPQQSAFQSQRPFQQNASFPPQPQSNTPFGMSMQPQQSTEMAQLNTPFGTSQTQPPFGAVQPQPFLPSQQQNTQSIFGPPQQPGGAQQNLLPFSAPSYTAPQPLWQQPNTLTSQSNSVFATQPPPNLTMYPSVINREIDGSVYSKLEDLSESDIISFNSDQFEFRKIPEKPPTQEMCL